MTLKPSKDLDGKRIKVVENSSVLTNLSFVVKNLENLHCANLLSTRKLHLSYFESVVSGNVKIYFS